MLRLNAKPSILSFVGRRLAEETISLMLFEEPSEKEIESRILALNKKNGDKDRNLKELFQVVIAHDDDNKFYFAVVHCVPENKQFTPASNNLGVLLKHIRSEILKHEAQMRNAEPPEEPSRIIHP